MQRKKTERRKNRHKDRKLNAKNQRWFDLCWTIRKTNRNVWNAKVVASFVCDVDQSIKLHTHTHSQSALVGAFFSRNINGNLIQCALRFVRNANSKQCVCSLARERDHILKSWIVRIASICDERAIFAFSTDYHQVIWSINDHQLERGRERDDYRICIHLKEN